MKRKVGLPGWILFSNVCSLFTQTLTRYDLIINRRALEGELV
jgi:hypothetical protein